MLMEMSCPNDKKGFRSFLDIINYMGKCLPSTAEVCKPVRRLISFKCGWTWNSTYQSLYNRAKTTIKKSIAMAVCNEKEQLYLEADVLGVGLGGSLLQVRDGMWIPRNETPDNAALRTEALLKKSLTSTKTQHSKIQRENPRHNHWIRKVPHYYFVCEVSMITDHKPVVTIFNMLHSYQTGCKEYYTKSSKIT